MWKSYFKGSVALGGLLLLPLPSPGPQAPASPPPVSVQNLRPESHTGPVEETFVAVEVVNTSADGIAQPPRRALGFLLRCDGFVLVPSNVFARTRTGKSETADNQAVTVILYPGTIKERRIAGVARPRYDETIGYTTIRLPAFHEAALRTLLPDTLKSGDEVEVVWRPWDEASRQWGKVQRKKARPAEAKEDDPPGFIRFSEPLEGVPAGAVVVHSEGMGLGMVPGKEAAGTRAGFVSFSILNRVTNCVSPVPTPDSAFHALVTAAQPGSGLVEAAREHEKVQAGTGAEMVKVPGGTVILPVVLLEEQPDLSGESIACMGDFLIDRCEVTNKEYRAFWNSLPEKTRNDPKRRQALFPLGWAAEKPYFPDEIGGVPVLGVSLEGASAYAKSVGKRLPTPYEWLRAAFGPEGEKFRPDWMRRYCLDRQAAWKQIREDHILVRRTEVPLGIWTTPVPWLPLKDPDIERKGYDVRAVRTSQRTTQGVLGALAAAWKSPLAVLPVGAREFDQSPYGAMDMILNADEMYLPNPYAPVNGGLRYFSVLWNYLQNWPYPIALGVGSDGNLHDISVLPRMDPGGYADNRGEIMSFPLHAYPGPREYVVSLSRLMARVSQPRGVKRVPAPFSVESAQALCNLLETDMLTYPCSGWQIAVGRGHVIGYDYFKLPDAVERIWSSGLQGMHQETARDPLKEGAGVYVPRGGDLRSDISGKVREGSIFKSNPADFLFLAKTGFRCAR